MLAALKAHKLPSQVQIDAAVRALLNSDVLDVSGLGYGPVSDDARKVVGDVRECLEALGQIGLEKNGTCVLVLEVWNRAYLRVWV